MNKIKRLFKNNFVKFSDNNQLKFMQEYKQGMKAFLENDY